MSDSGDDAGGVEVPDEVEDDREISEETDEASNEEVFNPNTDSTDENLDQNYTNPKEVGLSEFLDESFFNPNVDSTEERFKEDFFDPNIDPTDERFHEEFFDPNVDPSDERFQEEFFDPNVDPSDERFKEDSFDPNVGKSDELMNEMQSDYRDEGESNTPSMDNNKNSTDETGEEVHDQSDIDEKNSEETMEEINSNIEVENMGTDQSTIVLQQESEDPISRDKEGNIVLDADTMEFFGEYVPTHEEMQVEVLEEKLEELFNNYEDHDQKHEEDIVDSHEIVEENSHELQTSELENPVEQQEETINHGVEHIQEHSELTPEIEINKKDDLIEQGEKETIQNTLPENIQEIEEHSYSVNSREQHQEIGQESKQESYDILNEEDVKEQYKRETGRRPIYAGKETKNFMEWKEQLKQQRERQKENNIFLHEKEEKLQEQPTEIRVSKEEWAEYLTNRIKKSEFPEEIKENLKELLDKYENLRDLIKRVKKKEISGVEYEKELKEFKYTLTEKRHITRPLFMNFDWFRRYYNETIKKSGKRIADLYISKKTREFLAYISKRVEHLENVGITHGSVEKFREYLENSFQISENWALKLTNIIKKFSDKEIPSTTKKEIEKIIRTYCEIRAILFNKNLLRKDKEQLVQERIEKLNPRYFELFDVLRKFIRIHNDYSKNWMEKSLTFEGNKTIRYLSHKLMRFTNERALLQILNKESSSIQIFLDILKENLYKNVTLKLNEKSAIIKIIQENKPKEDKTKLITALSKLPTGELNSLLGDEFKKQAQKMGKMDSDYELFDDFLRHIHNIQFVNELITKFNKSGNWMLNFRPTKTFIRFINEKKEELARLFEDESNNTLKNQIDVLSKFSSLLTKIRDEDILNKVIKTKILSNPRKYNVFDIQEWLFLSNTSTRNQLNRILTKEEYNKFVRTQTHVSLDTIKKIATKKKGKCHTKSLKNAKSKLHLECAEGHHFHTSYDSIVYQGTWCPHCHIYMSESICRKFFEKIFKRPFPKSYPNWLINGKGNQMELDGYNKDLGLAFEYQGIQHRKKAFRKTEEELKNIQKEDALKLKLCKEHGVVLLQIPDDQIVPYSTMQDHIEQEYERKTGKSLKNVTKYDYQEFVVHENEHAKKFRDYVETKGGALITPYFTARKEVILMCEKGHQWTSTPNSVYKDNWCSECAGNKKGTTDFFRKIGEMFNCELISEYVNAKTLIKYKCKKGHEFEKSPYWLKKNFKNIEILCPKCKMDVFAGKFQEFVIKKGGQLATQYKGRFKPITIKCNKNHIWNTTPGAVYQGSWCKFCADEKHPNKKRIQTAKRDFIRMLETMKYKLLSEYQNNTKKVQIKCSKQHQFTMTPKYFKQLGNQGTEPCSNCRKGI